jgi:hypothetical protein
MLQVGELQAQEVLSFVNNVATSWRHVPHFSRWGMRMYSRRQSDRTFVGEILIYSIHNIYMKNSLGKLHVLQVERQIYIYHRHVMPDESNVTICNIILPLFEVVLDIVQSNAICTLSLSLSLSHTHTHTYIYIYRASSSVIC